MSDPKLRIVPPCNRSLPAWSVAIRARRLELGLTQDEAALRWGVAPRTIRHWEAGIGDGRMLAAFIGAEKGRAA